MRPGHVGINAHSDVMRKCNTASKTQYPQVPADRMPSGRLTSCSRVASPVFWYSYVATGARGTAARSAFAIAKRLPLTMALSPSTTLRKSLHSNRCSLRPAAENQVQCCRLRLTAERKTR